MKRRAFLRELGAAGGVALTSGLANQTASAARGRPLDGLGRARLAVSARVTRLDGAAAEQAEVILGPGGRARRATSAGALTLQASTVAARPDEVDLLATFRVRGRPVSAALGLRLSLGAWSRDSYLVLPGLCYGGNRFESRHIAYPPLLTEPADIGPNVPPIISDIPRLNLRAGPSGFDCPISDLASPAAAAFLPDTRRGIILLVDPATSVGGPGLGISESADRSSADIVVSAPFANDSDLASEAGVGSRARGAHLRNGDEVALHARLILFDCADVPALFARLFLVRKDLASPRARVHELPFSAAFASHEARVNRRWQETPGFYAIGEGNSAYSTWQTGWCDGFAVTVPLAAAGSPGSRERARRTSAFVLAKGQAPSGFFHAMSDGKIWTEDGFAAPLRGRALPSIPTPTSSPTAPAYRHAQRWHLVRRTADALLTLMKQLAFFERHPELREAADPSVALAAAARRAADGFVRLWDRYHQFGQFADIDTGDLLVGGSTSAGVASAGLARAAVRFNRDGYLRVARAAAEHFYDRYVRFGLSCGGPGDALQCPDSESAVGLLESFVTLYEVTREPIWLDRARTTAHLLGSWVVSYEPPEDRGAASGTERRLRATGAVLSDAQNGRCCPGYLLSSGDALFRLYRATGEVALLELLRDTVHNLPQYLRSLEPPPQADTVAAETRIDSGTRTDSRRWLDLRSEIVPVAGIFDAMALLAYTEVPGLYAQVDAGFVFAFDHVAVRIKERMGGKLVVALSNPTPVDAAIRLYAETSAEAAEPLPLGTIVEATTLVVPSGATVDVMLPAPVADRR